LLKEFGMNKTALLNSDIVGLRPYQKGSSSVLILFSFCAHGSYSSYAPPRISVSSGGTRRFLGFSQEFSPYFCTVLNRGDIAVRRTVNGLGESFFVFLLDN
jgi:hypothetical protein